MSFAKISGKTAASYATCLPSHITPMFLLALIGYHILQHEQASNDLDFNGIIESDKEFQGSTNDDCEANLDCLALQDEQANDIFDSILGFTKEFKERGKRIESALNEVQGIISQIKGSSGDVARAHIRNAEARLQYAWSELSKYPKFFQVNVHVIARRVRYFKLQYEVQRLKVVKLVQSVTGRTNDDLEANGSVVEHIRRNLAYVDQILAGLDKHPTADALERTEDAEKRLEDLDYQFKAIPQSKSQSIEVEFLKQKAYGLRMRLEQARLQRSSNESRSWASFCKAFLKVWDVIVKVVDAIFRGNDFDENVLLDAVEQKLGRSFQTRQITRTRVDGGVWVRGTADDIALSAYYHPNRAHSVAIRTGLEAKILPERQQVAQPGEWAIAIGPVESTDGNQALYRLE